ncbi:hypothetical protein PInf_009662 [Phytophthora infestans]|nr:hypothetical protein PInf_009662 [Phytophthora infestans]
MGWMRFAKDLASTKKQRLDEQSGDSLKSSPFYDVLLEHKDVLPEAIPAELPQDKGIQHEIDLVLDQPTGQSLTVLTAFMLTIF